MKYLKKHIIITILVLSILILPFNLAEVKAEKPTDISNHWAQDYIINLVNKNIMNLYSGDKFKPNQAITRGEFSVALAKQLQLLPVNYSELKDLNDYRGKKYVNALIKKGIINGYPDNTFKPNRPLSRAETVAILIKALGINKEQEVINLESYHPYDDIPQNHWALNNIKIARKLELIVNKDNKFRPKDVTTRAEAAKYLSKLNNLSSNTGYITDIYPASNKISVNLISGQRKIYNINDNSLVGRNNRIVNIDEILKTDKIFIISDTGKNTEYLKAYGMVTQQDLATEVSNITRGILEPTEVERLSEGNIQFLKPKLITSVRDELNNQGLSREEVSAIMNTEWNKLETLSKNRLAEAVAIETGLPLDITKSLLKGDWGKLKTYAQIELVQRMVQRVLNSDLIS